MSLFNNSALYPTPLHVIEMMLEGINLNDKVILEPSAGFGAIVDYCIAAGAADVLACEKSHDLVKILSTKCKVIGNNFLSITPDQISHIDLIVMNPPFSADETHILHAFNIARGGCKIIALCNAQTIENACYNSRKVLKTKIESYGTFQNLGSCFSNADRKTDVEIGLIILNKPNEAGANYDNEFAGFFTEEDPAEAQYNGLMPYNFIRDVVNRYIAAVKIYDQQLDAAIQMNNLTSNFYKSKLAMSCTEEGKPKNRNDFKKDLQKSAWTFIFGKMNMEKYTTQGLKDDLNKFVEKQNEIPFTMRNIYRMLEVIIGTQDQRMDKALLEVFDKLTQHYHDNRYNVEGWKTNSYYLINQKFILPCITEPRYSGGMGITHYDRNTAIIDDMIKALCYLTGENYDNYSTLWKFINNTVDPTQDPAEYNTKYVRYDWNTWYDFGFFEIKGFKKNTMHFKFKDLDVWGKFNQRISFLRGFPLFEHNKKAA